MPVKKGSRKRGAQPGNLNAYRHGFYSKHFKENELRDIDAFMDEGLSQEIMLMRITARRMMELAGKVVDIDKQVNILGAVGLAATRLAGLLRVKSIISGDENGEAAGAVSEALSEALKKWHRG